MGTHLVPGQGFREKRCPELSPPQTKTPRGVKNRQTGGQQPRHCHLWMLDALALGGDDVQPPTTTQENFLGASGGLGLLAFSLVHKVYHPEVSSSDLGPFEGLISANCSKGVLW